VKIPKRFKLMGRTVEVVEDPRLMQDHTWVGSAGYSEDKIRLQPRSEVYAASDSKLEQTFCHEFAHFLTYHAGGTINHMLKDGGYIHHNEEFVDLLGSLIHQALSTMEYK